MCCFIEFAFSSSVFSILRILVVSWITPLVLWEAKATRMVRRELGLKPLLFDMSVEKQLQCNNIKRDHIFSLHR